MEVTTETVGNVHVVSVNGELDASNVNDFRGMVLPLLASPIKLLIDLSETEFVDSSGLGSLIACQRRSSASGGKLKLCGMSPQVRSAVELLRLHLIFDIHSTREEALRAFAEGEGAMSLKEDLQK